MLDDTPLITIEPASMLERVDPSGRLEKYRTTLMAENQSVNLVSRETSCEDFNRLVAESLLPLEYLNLPLSEGYLDVGSGGGFPALPILLTKKVIRACLFERTGKKADALTRIISSLNLEVDLRRENFVEAEVRSVYGLVTMRYVKLNLPLLKKVLLCLTDGGFFIYYSTPEFTLNLRHIWVKGYNYKSDLNGPIKSFTLFQKQK